MIDWTEPMPNPQMSAYRDGTAKALTGIVGVYGTDWTDPDSNSHSERNTMGPQAIADLNLTDNELCQLHYDAGRRAMKFFTQVERLVACMARMDIHDPEYPKIEQTMRTCHEVGVEAHELQLEIVAVVNARRANADA